MRLLFTCFLLLLLGCSSLLTIADGSKEHSTILCDPDYTIPRIYSGVANDIRFLRGQYQDKGLVFWDLPFSLVVDTVALPYTICTQLKYGNLCTKIEKTNQKGSIAPQPAQESRSQSSEQ